jgi:hypothetical protein
MPTRTTIRVSGELVYHRVTLSYDVLVEGQPGESPEDVAARAIEQEQVRTGLRYRASAVDGRPVPCIPDDGHEAGDLWSDL